MTVRFEAAAVLTATIRGFADSEHAGLVSLALAPSGDRRGTRVEASLDEHGTARLGPIQPGEYELVVRTKQEHLWSFAVTRRPVVVRAGDNSATIPMPKFFAVTVTAPALQPGVQLRLSRIGARGSPHMLGDLDEHMQARFGGVPAGRYRLERFGAPPGAGSMEIELPGPTEIEFRPVAPNAYLVRIDDDAGSLTRIGLRDGDIVTGVNGKPFANPRGLRLDLTAARVHDEITLNVVRDGRRLEMTFRTADFEEGPSGGRFFPVHR